MTEEEALTSKLTQRIKRKTFQWGITSEKRLVQAEIRESIFKYTEKDGGKEKENDGMTFVRNIQILQMK